MELSEAIELIKNKNIPSAEQTVWADLGCGSGLFTHALAHLIKPDSKIYTVDKNADTLKRLQKPAVVIIEKICADFINDELNLHNLDGIIMANSLHYVQDKNAFIHKIAKCLKADGSFLVVEYDTDLSNSWVPYPLSYQSLKSLFEKTGYSSINKLHELPSRYNRAKIYAALIKK
jgi:ubiquinone/menaquinone biosynthesis C-methylase UbiE